MKVSTLRTWTWATIAQGPGMLVFFPNNPSMLASVSSTRGLLSCSWTGLSWKPVWVKTVIQNSVYTCIKLSKNSKKKSGLKVSATKSMVNDHRPKFMTCWNTGTQRLPCSFPTFTFNRPEARWAVPSSPAENSGQQTQKGNICSSILY